MTPHDAVEGESAPAAPDAAAGGFSWKTETVAGLTTFFTMAVILTVNPMILSAAGMPKEALFTATALATIAGTAIMGLYGRLPFALAPGMGLNAFFAYYLVMEQQYSWREALTVVLLSGLGFLALAVSGVRQWLVRGIPASLRHALGGGLGLMLAVIGLNNAGFLIQGEPLAALGDYTKGPPLLMLMGLAVTAVLWARGWKTAILAGIVFGTLVGLPMGLTDPTPLRDNGFMAWPPSGAELFFAFDFGRLTAGGTTAFYFLLNCFTLLLIDLFDGTGTFLGVLFRSSPSEKGVGLVVSDDSPVFKRALTVDALATAVGACFGTSTMTPYVESAAGMAAGGRTGRTALVVAGLFGLALFFHPLFLLPPTAAVAPALVLVGLLLLAPMTRIDFEDVAEGLSALVTLLVMAFTWSVTDGLAFGLLTWTVIRVGAGRGRDVSPVTWVLAGVFVLKAVMER